MTEQRRFPRVQLELYVQARFETIDHVVQATTVDVSRTGLFLAMTPIRPVGTHVRFSLAITSPPTLLELEGLVVRVQEAREDGQIAGVGVLLAQVPPEWERFCETLNDARIDAAVGEL